MLRPVRGDRVRAIRDLKGKTVAITELGLTRHVYVASTVAHVGLDTRSDVNFVEHPAAEGMRLLAEGKVDATKRALRAILKAADICALEPERAARPLVDGGFTPRYDYAGETLKNLPYNKWRVYDPEDSIRFFHALRLREAGMIKSAPQRLIVQGTDWRFFNELKRELKG